MGSVSFQPTADDLTAANRAYYAWSLRRPRFRRVVGIAAIIVPIIGFAISWGDRRAVQLIVAGSMLVAWLVLMAVLAGLQWLTIPRRSRRVFAQQRALHDTVTVEWSVDAIRIVSSRGEGRLAWSDYYTRTQSRAIILLFQSELLYNFIPKRVLTAGQAAEIMGAR